MAPTIAAGRATHSASATHMHQCIRQRPLLIHRASVLDLSMQMRAAIRQLPAMFQDTEDRFCRFRLAQISTRRTMPECRAHSPTDAPARR